MFDESFLPFIAKLNPTIMWIALTVGLLLFVIGYFAGGKLTMGRIGMCIFVVTIVGILALPAPIHLFSIAKKQMNVKTVHMTTPEEDTSKSTDNQSSAQTRAKTSPGEAASSETKPGETKYEESIPVGLQMLSFFMYIAWTAFLVGMGIFLYETLTVTAQEAERR